MERTYVMDPTPRDDESPGERSVLARAAQRLDVLFVLNNFSIGGSERKILRLAQRLRDEGARPAIACLNAPYTLADTLGREIPFWKLDRRGRLSLAAARRLRALIAEHRPVHTVAVNLYPSLYVTLATATAGQPRTHTVTLVNTSRFSQSRWRRTLYGALLRRMDHTVHGSRAQRRTWFVREHPAWRRSRVIYNGVDLARFAPGRAQREAEALRLECRIPQGRLVIGSVGRLSPEKNQLALLEALTQMKQARVDAHLVLAGDGPMGAELAQRAAELGVAKRVSFIGPVDDVRPTLALIDVFVLPSFAETFSNAALEAMSMGKPVILSDVGGAREMVEDGVEGFVVSLAELRARLPQMLAALWADPELRRRMGAAARSRAVRDFSLESMVASYRGLLGAQVSEWGNA